jgi:hypothetical protein
MFKGSYVRQLHVPLAAFSRTDLVALVGALALVACCSGPLFGNTRTRSERLVCMANLKEIGAGWNSWGGDHSQGYPWTTSTNAGGLRWHPLAANLWVQFAMLSNELRTPLLLACPSDAKARPAREFTSSTNGGYYHPTYRNNSISYFIGLHANFLAPYSLLGGDGNIGHNYSGSSCGWSRTRNVATMTDRNSILPWREGHHGTSVGHLLLADGEVREADGKDVAEVARGVEAYGGVLCIMLAR